MEASTTESRMLTTTEETGSHTDIASYIIMYGRPCVWVLGSTGNFLSFLVFCQRGMRKSLTGFLFLWLAVFDFIVVQESIQSFFSFANIDLFSQTNVSCKIVYWILPSCKMSAAWILVAIGIERLVCVVWPLKAKSICTLKKGRIFIGIIFLSGLIICVPYLLSAISLGYYEPSLDKIVRWCVYDWTLEESLVNYMTYGRPWVELALYSLIPWCLLFSVNIVIIIKLINSQRKRASMQEDARGDARGSSATGSSSLTIMLLVISVAFVVLTLPYCVGAVLDTAFSIHINELWAVGYILQGLNHSVNFILYCLSGRKFREEFKKLCFCRKGNDTTSSRGSSTFKNSETK